MVFLKSFFKSEDAYVTAAFLESEGIPATVFDDSSYGGNLMGTMDPRAIRIEVFDQDLERAVALLKDQSDLEKAAPEVPVVILPEAGKQEEKILSIFRFLILLELVLFWITAMYPGIYGSPPEEIQNYLNSMSFSDDGWNFVFFVWPVVVALKLLSSLMLLAMLKLGRVMYLFTVILELLLFWGPPPVILTSLGSTIGSIQWMLSGIIATMSFLPPASLWFRRRLTGTV